jgi:hypothetical protein
LLIAFRVGLNCQLFHRPNLNGNFKFIRWFVYKLKLLSTANNNQRINLAVLGATSMPQRALTTPRVREAFFVLSRTSSNLNTPLTMGREEKKITKQKALSLLFASAI